ANPSPAEERDVVLGRAGALRRPWTGRAAEPKRATWPRAAVGQHPQLALRRGKQRTQARGDAERQSAQLQAHAPFEREGRRRLQALAEQLEARRQGDELRRPVDVERVQAPYADTAHATARQQLDRSEARTGGT